MNEARNGKVLALLSIFAVPHHAFAAGDLSQQEPIEVRVDLGKAESDQHGSFPRNSHSKPASFTN